MPVSGVKLVDANIWLALAFSDHQHHNTASKWFAAQSDSSCAFCRITQLALLRHLTNSRIMTKFVQSQADAWRTHDALCNDPRVIFLDEPASTEELFRQFTQNSTPSHERWTDSFLAALAITAGAQLVTLDKDFFPYTGLDLLVLGS